MSITCEFNKKQLGEDLAVHFLPADIEGDGEANIDEYFNNYTIKENGHLTNALRGFPLDGCEFEIPDKYTGVVFQEATQKLDESANRLLRVAGAFKNFTYWNYDKIPSTGDPLRQALQAINVTNTLAKPVASDDFENELKKIN